MASKKQENMILRHTLIKYYQSNTIIKLRKFSQLILRAMLCLNIQPLDKECSEYFIETCSFNIYPLFNITPIRGLIEIFHSFYSYYSIFLMN